MTASWEIRSNVMSGDGGNLLFSGTDSASQTPTGRSGFGFSEYTVAVDVSAASPPVILGAGTYWLSVIPVDTADGSSFITNTDGTNSINVQPGTSDNTFFTSTDSVIFPGMPYFEPASNEIGSPADFSMGVIGTASVPEPSTLVLGLVGTLTVFGAARFRRRTRVG